MGGHPGKSPKSIPRFEPAAVEIQATFEVFPEGSLGEYTTSSALPGSEVLKRISPARRRDPRAKGQVHQYDPRPVADERFRVVSAGVSKASEGEPVNDGRDAARDWRQGYLRGRLSENLRRLTPGDEKDFEGSLTRGLRIRKVAGKTVSFMPFYKGAPQGLPKLEDEFARNSRFRTVAELRCKRSAKVYLLPAPAGAQQQARQDCR